MRNLFKIVIVFAVLSIVMSGFTSCTSTTSPSKDAAGSAAANTNAAEDSAAKNNNYPPAPSGIMQADIKDLEGNTFKLEDKKGKVVLVNLWGIWCAPCIAEMPHLIEMQNKFKDKDFQIVGLNVGNDEGEEEPAENIKTFAEKKKLNYQLGYADEKLFEEFVKVSRMAGVPQTILINREGKLTGVFTGGGPKIINSMKESVEKIVGE
ncbi:MAG: TlpA family protein disulfide reductase [Acidobacteriota bacterium]|nr:TlpA family protein disulfide reductase [Acidobacteriota bacterium]